MLEFCWNWTISGACAVPPAAGTGAIPAAAGAGEWVQVQVCMLPWVQALVTSCTRANEVRACRNAVSGHAAVNIWENIWNGNIKGKIFRWEISKGKYFAMSCILIIFYREMTRR